DQAHRVGDRYCSVAVSIPQTKLRRSWTAAKDVAHQVNSIGDCPHSAVVGIAALAVVVVVLDHRAELAGVPWIWDATRGSPSRHSDAEGWPLFGITEGIWKMD